MQRQTKRTVTYLVLLLVISMVLTQVGSRLPEQAPRVLSAAANHQATYPEVPAQAPFLTPPLAQAPASASEAGKHPAAQLPSSKPLATSQVQAQATLSNLPLRFEQNVGQSDPSVRYFTRGSGYTMFLTDKEQVLVLPSSTRHAAANQLDPSTSAQSEQSTTVLRYSLVGSSQASTLVSEGELTGKSNYFIGNDPAKWHMDVPSYARVVYKGVYPGVDVAYYGNVVGKLEHDFVVAAGANPDIIRQTVTGAESIEVADGDLVLHTPHGTVHQSAPRVYQDTANGRHEVQASYVLRGSNEVGFAVAGFDHSLALIIDPTIIYSTYLGGSLADNILDIDLDSSANTYVTGWTDSINFPTVTGSYSTTTSSLTGRNVFVTKLNAQGSALAYSTYLGSTGSDLAYGVAVDGSGNAYVTGYTDASSNFPTTTNLLPNRTRSNEDAFVTKLNATGSGLLFSAFLGGNGPDVGRAITVDDSNNIYVTGATRSTNFYTSTSAYQRSYAGGFYNGDAFLTKIHSDQSGNYIAYSTYLGGGGDEVGTSIALDNLNNIYVAGGTISVNFPVFTATGTTAVYQSQNGGGGSDIFVAKFNNAAEPQIVYATYLGGSGTDKVGIIGFNEAGGGVVADSDGNAYIAGRTEAQSNSQINNFPIVATNALQTQPNRGLCGVCPDGFVSKLNSTGNVLLYSTYLGGRNNDFVQDIALNSQGLVYVTGGTNSDDFPLKYPLTNNPVSAYGSVFVAKLDTRAVTSNTTLLYSTYIPGSGGTSHAIRVDNQGNAYLAGETGQTNFPTTVGAFQRTNAGGLDGFVTKINDVNPCTLNASDTKKSEDEFGADLYQVDVSCGNTGQAESAKSVVEQANTLGTYTIDLPLEISRYYGPTQTGAYGTRLVNEALGTTVADRALLMVVGNNIKDEVIDVVVGSSTLDPHTYRLTSDFLINNMPGVNRLFTVQSAAVETKWLQVPDKGTITYDANQEVVSTAPVPAVNRLTIKTSPSAVGKIKRVVLYLPAMRPLLLFGGAGGASSGKSKCGKGGSNGGTGGLDWWYNFAWDSRYAPHDVNDPIYSFVVDLHRDPCVTIQAGGEDLYNDVEAIAKAYGVKRVNFIAHSAGGLWARSTAEFLYNKKSSVRTDNLIMIGTPNLGSFWLNSGIDPFFVVSCSDIVCQMQPDYMALKYNHEHGSVPSVYYKDIIGVDNNTGDVRIKDDGAVKVYSSQGLQYSHHLPVIAVTPASNSNIHTEEIQRIVFRDALDDYYLMTGNHGYDDAFLSSELGLRESVTQSNSVTYYPVGTSTINYGQIVSGTILVDSTTQAHFALSWLNPSSTLNLSLRDPMGRVITATSSYSGSSYVSPIRGIFNGVGYIVTSPLTGTWHYTVEATVISGTNETFYVGANLLGGLLINPELNRTIAPLNQPVVITATLRDTAAVAGALVSATIPITYMGSYSSVQVPLVEQAGGIYRGMFTPTYEGVYPIKVQAQGLNSRSERFNRVSDVLLQASSSAALTNSFAERVEDVNADGLYDSLVVSATAVITEQGRYQLSANLTKPDGTTLANDTNYYTLTAGTQPLTVTFSGERIGKGVADGPYQVRDVLFSRILSQELTLAYVPIAYTTTAYSRYYWQRDNVVRAGRAVEQGVDLNGNGLYEYLEVRVPLDLRTPNRYRATANLRTLTGTLVASAYTSTVSVVSGTTTLLFRFDGGRIRAATLSGPYAVTDLNTWAVYDDQYTALRWVLKPTSSYAANQFETPPPPTPAPTETPCSISFSDVKTSYVFYNSVIFVACRNVMEGYPDGTFKPNDPVSRGAFAKILKRAFNIPSYTPSEPTFSDVDASNVFYPFVEAVYHAGILQGYPPNQCIAPGASTKPCFKPNNNVQRDHVAIGIRRAADFTLYTPLIPTFADVPVSYPGYEAIETLVHLSILDGKPCADSAGLCFYPRNSITRGEMSKVANQSILAQPLASCYL